MCVNEFEKLIEKILHYFAGEDFKNELIKAKKEFFDNTTLNEEQSDQYELRMSQFYDWYFFSRELSGYGQTPLEVCHLARELRFTEEEEKNIAILKEHRHSIFEFIKIKDRDITIKDLMLNKKLVVKNSALVFGFNPEELFEARLVPVSDTWIFTRGFCFHPENAKKFILSEVKTHRKNPDLDPEAMMLRLIRMRYKYEQYKHVRPEVIYSNDGKLGM